MTVRPARKNDRAAVLAMMARLWPDEEEYEFEPRRTFVWDSNGGEAGPIGGFASFSLRPYVDGCGSSPVPHVEGWWVDPELRRGGIGRALIDAIERWASGQGFRELGSDTLLANRIGREAHAGLGFEPTEQIQYFRKRLR